MIYYSASALSIFVFSMLVLRIKGSSKFKCNLSLLLCARRPDPGALPHQKTFEKISKVGFNAGGSIRTFLKTPSL
jgi:hypothetical protein